MKTLKDVRKFLFSIPYISDGGCGIAALAMIRWMKSNLNLERPNIYFIHRWGDAYANNKQYIKSNNGTPVAPSHVAVSYKGKVFDVEERILIKKEIMVLHTNSEEVLIKSLNNVGTWNNCFDRKRYVPIIEKTLNVNLSDVSLKKHSIF